MRSAVLAATKKLARILAVSKPSAKLIKLVAEEYAVATAAVGTQLAAQHLRTRIEPTVRRGLFAGMEYPSLDSSGSAFWPKILGTYELEIESELLRLLAHRPTVVVDIGAAEGYYAVGIARRLPDTRVIAFEADPRARELLSKMIAKNNVEGRVDVRGHCSAKTLQQTLTQHGAGRTLLICDAETAEYEIFGDAETGVDLREVDIIVELHASSNVPDPFSWMQQRFAATHSVRHICSEVRSTADYAELADLSINLRHAVLFERTDLWGWAICEAKTLSVA